MAFSKRSLEGYLMIDHRACMGLETAPPGAIAVPGGALYESATNTCSHCQRIIVLNPNRSRERGYCPKCDNFVCDTCETERTAAGGECFSFNKRADEYLNNIVKRGT